MSDEHPASWLRAARIQCPHCGEMLYRHDHSPMADNWVFFCDQCPNRIEINHYDPIVLAIDEDLRKRSERDYKNIMAQVEQQLISCTCGGNYRHDAPRRCHNCYGIVVESESGVDLWPVSFDTDDPTEDDFEYYEQFAAKHIRTKGIWKDSSTQPNKEA